MMHRLVSLPMYAVPAGALAIFWRGLRAAMCAADLADVPATLGSPDDLGTHWRDPDLLLSQTCGFPLVTQLAGRVKYVGTPTYRVDGCEGSSYRSAIVVRANEPETTLVGFKGRRVAFNSTDSQSGYNSLRAEVAPLAKGCPFFSGLVETGSHRASIAALRDSTADLAAIDVVTLELLQRDHPGEWDGLRVLSFTKSAPGLPFITSAATSQDDVTRLRTALHTAFADADLAGARAAMLLDGFNVLPDGAYGMIAATRDAAVACGYPLLA